jgi:hypothetical protein
VIGLVVFILIAALLLSAINRVVNGFWAHYGRAIGTVVLAGIVSGIINWAVGKGLHGMVYVSLAIGVVVQAIVGGWIMNWLVRRPDGSPLGFGKAAVVFLIYAIIWALVGLGAQHLAASMKAAMPAAQ